MGIDNHNCIIASTYNDTCAKELRSWIETLSETERGLFVENRNVLSNKYFTFVMTPDGSKEGWPESDRGDALRRLFITFLKAQGFSDGSSPWKYVEVGFGEYGAAILRTNCHNCMSDKTYGLLG